MECASYEKAKHILLKYLILIFILLQPVLDTYYLFTDNVVTILKFSPSTIIRFLFVGILFIATLALKPNRKSVLAILIYIILSGLYLITHILLITRFSSPIIQRFAYSNLQEIFYVARLILPILLMFVFFNFQIDLRTFYRVMTCLAFISSFSIFISNILVISLDSYTNKRISANIFSWFSDGYLKYGFNGLASKGFFNFANQTASFLLMLLPITFNVFLKFRTPFSIMTLVIQMISLIMLGTKISTFGSLAVFVCCLAIYLFFCFVKKIKFSWRFFSPIIILLIFCLVLIPKSPAVYRLNVANNVNRIYSSSEASSQVQSENSNQKQSNSSKISSQASDREVEKQKDNSIKYDELGFDQKVQYIAANYKSKQINETFITKSYPYQYDPDFWFSIMQLPIEKRLDYRFIEISMVDHLKQLNNNRFDFWIGISYSRMINVYNIERDFVAQYNSLGILGLILFFSPFVIILIFSLYRCLKYIKKYFMIENINLILSCIIVLLTSWLSGNTLDGLLVSLTLSFILMRLLLNVVKNEESLS